MSKRWIVVGIAAVLAVIAARHLIDRGDSSDRSVRRAAAAGRPRVRPTTAVMVAADDLAQPDAPRRRLAGRVVFQGAAVAGATVTLEAAVTRYEWFASASERIAEVTSGADGGFDFGDQPAARFSIEARGDNSRVGSVSVELADPRVDPEHVVVELRRRDSAALESDGNASLVGRVIDDGGRAVPGARVVAAVRGGGGFINGPARWSPTDDAGRFAIDGLAPGLYGLAVVGRGLTSDAVTTVLAKPGVSDEIVLATVTRARVRGRLTAGGVSLPGVQVVVAASARPGDMRALRGYTQRDGRFAIDGVPLGRVRFTASGYPIRQPWIVVDRVEGVDVALETEAPCTVRGRVHEHGGPASDVSLWATWADNQGTGVKLDAGGAFELVGISPGRLQLSAVCRGLSRERTIELAPGETKALDLDVACGPIPSPSQRTMPATHDVRIEGHVVDDAGDPMPGVGVSTGWGHDATDDSGHFALAGRWFGERFPVYAHTFDGAAAQVDDVPNGADIEIRFRRAEITGEVTGFRTTPKVTAQSVLGGKIVETAIDDDEFAFRDLPPGSYWVEAHAGDDVDAEIVVLRSAEPVRVELSGRRDGRTLHGRVLDPATQTALPGMACQLAAVGPAGVSLGEMPVAITDPDGRFSLTATSHVWSAGVIACWSSRGPATPATATPLPRWYGGAGDPDEVALFATRAHAGDGYAGFVVAPLTLPLAVAMVDAGSPADRSGLAAGDRILAIDDEPVDNLVPQAAMWKVWAHPAGSLLVLRVDRRGALRTIRIVVAR